MMKLCFASNNLNKLEEVKAAVKSNFEIVSLADVSITEEVPETQDTLEGNAIQKAEYVFNKVGIPCFADDSGLEVEALNREPGVFSARYAGPQRKSDDNIDLLLKNLTGISNRKAKFRTVIALVGMGSGTELFQGSIEGQIITQRRGNFGFGYDPVFLPDGYDKTFAEMTIGEKTALSHRALAVKELIKFLNKTKGIG